MKQPDISSLNDKDLANAVKNALDQSTQDLDAETLKLLREARFKALEKKKLKIGIWAWPTMAAAAALSAFIILPTVMHKQSADMEQAKVILEYSADDEVASLEDIDMLEDLDLIQAVSEEAGNEQT